jgi:hypothetical protein
VRSRAIHGSSKPIDVEGVQPQKANNGTIYLDSILVHSSAYGASRAKKGPPRHETAPSKGFVDVTDQNCQTRRSGGSERRFRGSEMRVLDQSMPTLGQPRLHFRKLGASLRAANDGAAHHKQAGREPDALHHVDMHLPLGKHPEPNGIAHDLGNRDASDASRDYDVNSDDNASRDCDVNSESESDNGDRDGANAPECDDPDYAVGLPTWRLILKLRRLLASGRRTERLICRYLADLADRVRQRSDATLDAYADELHAARCFFGLGARDTRERVRVGRALRQLPQIERAFVEGELAYSRVREVTRVATAETELLWLELADRLDMRALERRVAGAGELNDVSQAIDATRSDANASDATRSNANAADMKTFSSDGWHSPPDTPRAPSGPAHRACASPSSSRRKRGH